MASNVENLSEKMEQSRISNTDKKVSVEYFPLKLVQDKKTEMYVKFAKVMVIVQGPHSSKREKSSRDIATAFKYTSRILTDKKFTEETTISCTFTNTEDYYCYLKLASMKALENGNNLLVIDSTMSNMEQNKYYVALAVKMQFVVLVVPPVVIKTSRNNWPRGSLADSFRIDAYTIIQPTNMFQHLFCAWYLHDVDSHELRHEATLYIQDCLEEIPEFRDLLDKNCPKEGPDEKELSLIDVVRQYFNLVDKRQPLAYCAMKIFGDSMRLMNEYFKKQSVQETYGKMSKLYITGYIISPYMIAARVKLTHHQKDLWEMPEEMEEVPNKKCEDYPFGPWRLFKDLLGELPEVDVQLIASKSNQTLVNTRRTIYEPLELIHPFSKGRACHFILGKKAFASSHHIDFGVQFALDREKKALRAKAELPTYELERCVVKRNGKYWFIYLRENMCIDAFFASCVKPYPFDTSFCSF